jgi:hypothetical protein
MFWPGQQRKKARKITFYAENKVIVETDQAKGRSGQYCRLTTPIIEKNFFDDTL